MRRIFLCAFLSVVACQFLFCQNDWENDTLAEDQADSIAFLRNKKVQDTTNYHRFLFLKYSATQLYQNKITLAAEYFICRKFSLELRCGVGSLELNKEVLFNKIVLEPELNFRLKLPVRRRWQDSLRIIRQLVFRFSYLYGEYRNKRLFYQHVQLPMPFISYEIVSGYFNAVAADILFSEKIRLWRKLYLEVAFGAGIRYYENNCSYDGFYISNPAALVSYPEYPFKKTEKVNKFHPYLDAAFVWMMGRKSGN